MPLPNITAVYMLVNGELYVKNSKYQKIGEITHHTLTLRRYSAV